MTSSDPYRPVGPRGRRPAGRPRAAAAQAAKPTVAIMYFNNNVFTKDARDYDGLTKGVPDFLVTEMASNPNIRVIERDQVQKLIDEQKLTSGGQVDRETAVKVGKLLGAQHMIFGGFMADPKGNFRIDARAVNVEIGRDRVHGPRAGSRRQRHGPHRSAGRPPQRGAQARRADPDGRRRCSSPPGRGCRCASRCCTARRSTWPTRVTRPRPSSCSEPCSRSSRTTRRPEVACQGEARRLTVRDSTSPPVFDAERRRVPVSIPPAVPLAMKPLLLTALGEPARRRAARPSRRRRRGAGHSRAADGGRARARPAHRARARSLAHRERRRGRGGAASSRSRG